MSKLLLGDGSEHIVGQPVEPAPEQVADAHAALENNTAEPALTECRTAFTVYLTEDGDVLLGDLVWARPAPSRPPTFDEMYHAASVLQKQVSTYAWREPGDVKTCLTAFTPYLTHDGRWLISADPNDPLVTDREPTADEYVGGLAVVLRDVHTQEIGNILNNFGQAIVQSTTQSVVANLARMSQQAIEAQQAANIAAQLEADKQRRGGR